MTRQEIADLLDIPQETLKDCFKRAKKVSKSIRDKMPLSTEFYIVDYTLDEALVALSLLSYFTPMMKEYLIDNYFERESGFLDLRYQPKKIHWKIEKFIFRYKQNHKFIRVCANCCYLAARLTDTGERYRPYCTLYDSFIPEQKMNVYEDRCRSWKFTGAMPFIFLPEDYPQRINIYHHEPKTTLGISNALFKSKKTPSAEPVCLRKVDYIDD